MTLRRTDGRTLEPVLDVLRASGCEITQSGDTLRLCSDGGLRAPSAIETAPYPGFPTDAQAIVMACLLYTSQSDRAVVRRADVAGI